MAGPQGGFTDRRLALMFACADPAIEAAMHAPLMLQTLLGLNAEEIGAAYLVPPKTMGQRLVRAKARIKAQGLRLEEPEPEQFASRFPGVLDALYAAFTRDWSGQDGNDLADEAIWLADAATNRAGSKGPARPNALRAGPEAGTANQGGSLRTAR